MSDSSNHHFEYKKLSESTFSNSCLLFLEYSTVFLHLAKGDFDSLGISENDLNQNGINWIDISYTNGMVDPNTVFDSSQFLLKLRLKLFFCI